jgi:hypothetical protein
MIGLFLYLSISTLQEFMLDSIVRPVGAPDRQYVSAVAFDGANRLVVWEDYRNNNWDIYGTRITGEGVVLDTNGILISVTPVEQRFPSVAFDGTNYLVVWQDNRNGDYDIYGCRITPSGVILDPDGILISTTPNSHQVPAVSFDGTNYLVVWSENSGVDFDIYGAFVSPSGTVLNTVRISTASNNQTYPSIAFDGVNYLVAWQDYRNNIDYPEIYCSRITVRGTVLDPAGIRINYGYHPSVVFGDSLYFVVWTVVSNLNYTYAARIRPDGIVLDPNGICVFTGDFLLFWPTVSYDNTNFLVVSPWQYYGIYAQRVTPQGVVLDPAGIPISEGDYPFVYASAIFDGTNYLVNWSDWRNGCFPQYSDIYGARITPSMNILDPEGILISTCVNMQSLPSVGFNGTNYLAVWTDGYLNSGANLRGTRITVDGTIIDTARIPISNAMYSQYLSAVGSDGADYFVAWSSEDPPHNGSTALFGSVVSAQGMVFDEIWIASGMGDEHFVYPQIAFDGNNYFCVYERDVLLSDTSNIEGAFVTPDGVLLDRFDIWISHNGPPSVAFGTTKYLVVWQEKRNSSTLEICGAFVTPAGMVSPLWNPIIVAPGDQELPQIAFDGTNYLVVWQDRRSGSYDIYGTRVTQTGTTLDPNGIAISTAPNDQVYPAIIFDGTNYIVVWQDRRNGDNYDIYGARVTTAGEVLDPTGVELVNQPTDRLYPKISKGPGNQFLLVYQGFVPDAPYNTWRVFGALRGNWGIEETALSTTSNVSRLEVYPNPFRNAVSIKFQIPEQGVASSQKSVVSIKIYDASGRMVKQFNHLTIQPFNQVVWDGTDDFGRRLPAGIYFIRLESNEFKRTEKVVLLR